MIKQETYKNEDHGNQCALDNRRNANLSTCLIHIDSSNFKTDDHSSKQEWCPIQLAELSYQISLSIQDIIHYDR